MSIRITDPIFSEAVLVLESVPVPIGGTLRGKVEITKDAQHFADARNIIITLSRGHRPARQNFRPTWQHTVELPRSALQLTPSGVVLPLQVEIPNDADELNEFDMPLSVQWMVDVRIDRPGADYGAQFEVPLKRTADSPDPSEKQHASDPPVHTIAVRESGDALELDFAPFRARSSAVAWLVVLVVWTGIALFTLSVSRLGSLGMAVVGILLLWATLEAWLRSSRVVVKPDSIVVERRLVVTTSRLAIPKGDIEDVWKSVGGGSSGRSPRLLHEIRLQKRDGKRITLGGDVADSREAAWLVQVIRDRLALAPRGAVLPWKAAS